MELDKYIECPYCGLLILKGAYHLNPATMMCDFGSNIEWNQHVYNKLNN